MTPIFATRRTAAALLDMSPLEFSRLLVRGDLPPPHVIGEHHRWSVDELRDAIIGRPKKVKG